MAPDDMDVVIRIQGVSKCYESFDKPYHRLIKQVMPGFHCSAHEFWALRDINLEILRGETLAIIGRNGSGKSTLLQMLCGTLTPTSGNIEVTGRIAALLELGAGFNPDFTGVENVMLNASILGLSRQDVDARMDAILDFAGIGEFAYKPVKVYSSGMYLRLAFSVIAHVDADILVIDEALAVGDILFAQKCMRFLREFQKKGTIIFVSHDTSMVTGLCERACWLESGVIRMLGSAKNISEAYLEYMYAEQQSVHIAGSASSDGNADADAGSIDNDSFPVDIRHDLMIHSNLRNDLQVFVFDPDVKSFGTGGARIMNVLLQTDDGRRLSWIVGGELVCLAVCCRALRDLEGVIVGFMFKNRMGQTLFGDNTYLAHVDDPVRMSVGQTAVASFKFRMPYLPAGDYVFSVAIAEGSQDEHVQLQWIHDALVIRCDSQKLVSGLVGIPMSDICLTLTS